MNLTGTFLRPTISLSEKLTNGTLVSSLPDGLCAETWPDIEGRGFYWLRISAQCTSNNYGKYSDTHGEMKLCSDDEGYVLLSKYINVYENIRYVYIIRNMYV